MIEALFLDRDGIINEIIMRGQVVGSPRNLQELKIRDEFPLFYREAALRNIPMWVVSNQPDVRRNLMRQNDLDAITASIKSLFPTLEFVYCLHDNQDGCLCRKPKPGLIESLIHKHGFKAENCILVGDSHKDITAGNQAKVFTVLLRTSYNSRVHALPSAFVDRLTEIIPFLELGS